MKKYDTILWQSTDLKRSVRIGMSWFTSPPPKPLMYLDSVWIMHGNTEKLRVKCHAETAETTVPAMLTALSLFLSYIEKVVSSPYKGTLTISVAKDFQDLYIDAVNENV